MDLAAATPATAANARDDGRSPRQRQRTSVTSLLFISFVLFMLTNRNSEEALARNQYLEALEFMDHQLSNYSAWLNSTETDFILPERHPAVFPLIESFITFDGVLDPSRTSYYSNISGVFDGDAKFHNLTAPPPVNESTPTWTPWADRLLGKLNETEKFDRLGTWNWASTGKVGINMVDRMPPKSRMEAVDEIAVVHGRIELTDVATKRDLNLVFEGIHFVSNGSIYGFAEPNRVHPDLRELPSIVPEHALNATAYVIEAELSARITKTLRMIEAGTYDPDTPNEDTAQTTCSFSFFAQVLPARVPRAVMEELEAETETPTGITTIPPPEMSIRGMLLSEDCGLVYTFEHTDGISSKRWYRKVKTYGSMAAVLYLVLAILLSRQITLSRTPAGISRVSRWTFLSQSIVDSISFASHATFAILSTGRTSLSLFAAGFLALVLFVYEVQFAFLIHQIQAPEDVPVITTLPPPPAQGATTSPTTPSSAEATPAETPAAPAGAEPGELPREPPGMWRMYWQYLRSDPHGRLWLIIMTIILMFVPLIVAPSLGFLFTATLYSSFWAPQIARSARRGRSSGLSMEYVVGTTVCRLLLALYFLACPKNVLDVQPRPWIWGVAVIMFLQIGVLVLQDYLGPSFFLPKSWAAEPTYDYHPPLPLPDSEAPERSLGDCSICMDAILLDAGPQKSISEKSAAGGQFGVGEGSASAGGLLNAMHMGVGAKAARKNYSLAPCHHLFHTECLERWLAVKNICPQCRRPLPPI